MGGIKIRPDHLNGRTGQKPFISGGTRDQRNGAVFLHRLQKRGGLALKAQDTAVEGVSAQTIGLHIVRGNLQKKVATPTREIYLPAPEEVLHDPDFKKTSKTITKQKIDRKSVV